MPVRSSFGVDLVHFGAGGLTAAEGFGLLVTWLDVRDGVVLDSIEDPIQMKATKTTSVNPSSDPQPDL